MKTALVVLLLVVCLPAAAQSPYLVKDINTTYSRSTGSSSPSAFARFGSRIYFAATTLAEGTELWSTDGTEAGTKIVSDIVPGAAASNPTGLVVVNGALLFLARDVNHGIEWWTTDGTAAGTRLLIDINPGPSSAQPANWIAYQNRLLFSADDGINGRELWTTDGTAAGTRMLKDLNPGNASGSPVSAALFNGAVYFGAASALWKTDGTEAGTVKVASVPARNTVAAGSRLFFEGFTSTTGYELWTSDGSEAGTRMVTEIRPGTVGGLETPYYFFGLKPLGNRILFPANDGVQGRELWASDGTAAGTLMLRELLAGSKGPWDNGGLLTATLGDRLYFSATDDEHGLEMWSTDGTPEGTALFADLEPGPNGSLPANFTTAGGKLFFSKSASFPTVYVTDGTVAGTRALGQSNVPLQYSFGGGFTAIDGSVYFAGSETLHGTEPWVSDGTDSGTRLIANISKDEAPSSHPGGMTAAGNLVFFFATEGPATPRTLNIEASLWRSDGTAAGTFKLMETPHPSSSLIAAGPYVFFQLLNIPASRTDWWMSDGTIAGTTLADPFFARFGGLKLDTFLPVGESLYATVFEKDSSTARSLWKTTAAPDAPATRLASRPGGPIEVGGQVMFFSTDNFSRPSLWKTDGTPEGTYAVIPALGDAGVSAMVNAGGTVFFMKALRDEPNKLWKSDGTFDGTTIVKELPPPQPGTFRTEIKAAGRRVFFDTGGILWVSDGTAAGTVEFHRATFQPSSNPTNLYIAGDRLVFMPWDQVTGTSELWGSDGTPEGTKLLRKLGNNVPQLVSIDGLIYFTAEDAEHGFEAWVTDGTPEGTKMLFDLNPGPASSLAGNFGKAGNLLYFDAYTEGTGSELWALPLTQPRLSIRDTRAAEGDASTTNARFTVTLDPPAAGSVTVEWATSDGTARAGEDYDAASGTLTFAPAETAKSVEVRVRGDVAPENNETLFVALRNPSGATLLKREAFAIVDDDDQFADLGIASSVQFDSFRLADPVIAVNGGPRTATDVQVKFTATNATPSDCFNCSIPQLANGATATVTANANGAGGTFKTATISARQRDLKPDNNSVGWVITSQKLMAIPALFIHPGETIPVTLVNFLAQVRILVQSSDPSVVSVPAYAQFNASTDKTTTFTATALKPGVATITADKNTDALPVVVVAEGTTPRWPAALAIDRDYSSGGSRFDQPLAFRAGIAGTAPFSGAAASGAIIVSLNGVEITRRALDGKGAASIQFYPKAINGARYDFAYSGDANFLPQTNTVDASVGLGVVTLLGGLERGAAAGTFTLGVHARGSAATPPTGTITVKNGATQIAQIPLVVGTGESTASTTLSNLPASPVLTIQYSGDAFHSPSTQDVRVVEPRKRTVKH